MAVYGLANLQILRKILQVEKVWRFIQPFETLEGNEHMTKST